MKNARGSYYSVQSGVTFHVSDFQLLRLSFNDTCSRRAGVAVMQARCIPGMLDWHIDRVNGYPASYFVVFASISRRLPGYYTSLQHPLPSKSSPIHSWNHLALLRYSHDSPASSKNNSRKKSGTQMKITPILYSRRHLLQCITFIQNAVEFVRATLLHAKFNAASKISKLVASARIE